jgi:energy-coupling factor transporter ATP-binding protein EcfA2
LHASAVDIRGRAVCFCGDAGSGKSTTAAALALRGHPVLAEDIVALEESGGEFRAVPGYPRVCLWPESVSMLFGHADALPQITPTWEKHYFELDGTRAKFSQEKLPLGVVYLIASRSSEENTPLVEKLTPREAFLGLVQSTYMNWVLSRKQRANEFETLCRLVQQIPVRRIVLHTKPESIARLCELILQDATSVL